MKFGGTSVGDSDAIERAASVVAGRLPRAPLVVVSAAGGTTSQLLALAEQASHGHLIGAVRAVENIRERHLGMCDSLLGNAPGGADVIAEIGAMCDELASLAEALATLGHITPRSRDAVASFGEQMSSLLVTEAFRARGIPAQHVDARDVMVTSDHFTEAEPIPDAIADRARDKVAPMIRDGSVPVVGGYIGATADGITTTLGRGGSDYTASLLGAALGAEDIEIWTDVDGMLTADPRVVRDAHLIPEIRFDEASELASFGAKVLHPNTIAPAVRRGIPVYIYNTRNPLHSGTRITFDAPRRPVTAIAAKNNVTMIKVSAPRMLLAHGFLRNTFEIFERHRTSVDVVATSEVSVSATLDDADRLDELIIDLRMLGDVSLERDRAVVAIVGSGIGDGGDCMGRALRALGDTRIHMVSLSATGINLTVVVDGAAMDDAMLALHAEFFSGAIKE
ncbi:MAG: lysine-sensitive aspartokinase 3 [Gemmatimonadota bacterium]|nr:lysine-sensitive aspartokinase 3 [Gemmatimonadota bacterium]